MLRLNLASLIPPCSADPEDANWPAFGPLVNARLVTIEVIRINGADTPALGLDRAIKTFAGYVAGKVDLVNGESAQLEADGSGRVSRKQLEPVLTRRKHRRACDIAIILTPGLSDSSFNGYCASLPEGGHVVVISARPGPRTSSSPRRPLTRRLLGGLLFRNKYVRQLLITHELLHALRVPCRRERRAIGHHCTRPDCLLYHNIDWRFMLAALVNLGPPTDLCRFCQADICAAQAAAAGRFFEPDDPYDTMMYLDEWVRFNPEDALVYMHRAQARADRRDDNGALADLTEALRIGAGTRTAMCYGNRAVTHANQQRWAEAFADFDEALKADSQHLFTLIKVSWFLLYCPDRSRHNAARARELLCRADAITKGRDARALGLLGTACAVEGRFAEAVDTWGRCLTVAPNNSFILASLGFLLATCPEAAIRNGARAMELAQRACDLTHLQQAWPLAAQAAACAEKGDFQQAIQFQQKAVELSHLSRLENERQALAEYQAGRPRRAERESPENAPEALTA